MIFAALAAGALALSAPIPAQAAMANPGLQQSVPSSSLVHKTQYRRDYHRRHWRHRHRYRHCWNHRIRVRHHHHWVWRTVRRCGWRWGWR
ncbi:MAG: hypothetical protein GC182_10375 [Rhodopseudomonas sp.]|nr:hypothetical protein [Rhodopseudomonas sp.]